MIKEIYLFDNCLHIILDDFFNQDEAMILKEKIIYILNDYKIDLIKIENMNNDFNIFFNTLFKKND